jgi:hypothetical protein
MKHPTVSTKRAEKLDDNEVAEEFELDFIEETEFMVSSSARAKRLNFAFAGGLATLSLLFEILGELSFSGTGSVKWVCRRSS